MKTILVCGLILCTMTSCISVGLDDKAAAKVDEALAEIKRFNTNLEAYEKDLADILKMIHSVIDPRPKTPEQKPDAQQDD